MIKHGFLDNAYKFIKFEVDQRVSASKNPVNSIEFWQETSAAVLSVVVKDTMKARDKDGALASWGHPWWIFPNPLFIQRSSKTLHL